MAIQDYIIAGGKYGTYNHYQLLLKKLNQERPDIHISVLKFSGSEAISQIPRYEIEFTSATPDIPANLLINYSAQLLMYPDGKPYEKLKPRIIPGIITRFRQCNTSADETRYVAVLEHKMARMAQGRNSAVFLNDSIISLTENTFGDYLIDKLSFVFKLTDRYPPRDFMLQYGESDYDHVSRRLADSGVSFYRQYDEENDEDVIVLTDHSGGWIKGPANQYSDATAYPAPATDRTGNGATVPSAALELAVAGVARYPARHRQQNYHGPATVRPARERNPTLRIVFHAPRPAGSAYGPARLFTVCGLVRACGADTSRQGRTRPPDCRRLAGAWHRCISGTMGSGNAALGTV